MASAHFRRRDSESSRWFQQVEHGDRSTLACAAEGECEPLSGAVVEFGPLDEEVPARVTVRVTHAGGGVEAGQVDAGWLEPADLCG